MRSIASRCSNSGTATRRVVPSAWRACDNVNGWSSWAIVAIALSGAEGCRITSPGSRRTSPAVAAAARTLFGQARGSQLLCLGRCQGVPLQTLPYVVQCAASLFAERGAAARACDAAAAGREPADGVTYQCLDEADVGKSQPPPGRLDGKPGFQRFRRVVSVHRVSQVLPPASPGVGVHEVIAYLA